MSFSLPNPWEIDLGGIPQTFHIDIDNLPKITLDIDPLTLSVDLKPVKLELAPIKADLNLNARLLEIPSVRVHLPANFHAGLRMLGCELIGASLCGEAQVITEPYAKNPCEHCGETHKQTVVETAPRMSSARRVRV